jgi:hypothetical protein
LFSFSCRVSYTDKGAGEEAVVFGEEADFLAEGEVPGEEETGAAQAEHRPAPVEERQPGAGTCRTETGEQTAGLLPEQAITGRAQTIPVEENLRQERATVLLPEQATGLQAVVNNLQRVSCLRSPAVRVPQETTGHRQDNCRVNQAAATQAGETAIHRRDSSPLKAGAIDRTEEMEITREIVETLTLTTATI